MVAYILGSILADADEVLSESDIRLLLLDMNDWAIMSGISDMLAYMIPYLGWAFLANDVISEQAIIPENELAGQILDTDMDLIMPFLQDMPGSTVIEMDDGNKLFYNPILGAKAYIFNNDLSTRGKVIHLSSSDYSTVVKAIAKIPKTGKLVKAGQVLARLAGVAGPIYEQMSQVNEYANKVYTYDTRDLSYLQDVIPYEKISADLAAKGIITATPDDMKITIHTDAILQDILSAFPETSHQTITEVASTASNIQEIVQVLESFVPENTDTDSVGEDDYSVSEVEKVNYNPPALTTTAQQLWDYFQEDDGRKRKKREYTESRRQGHTSSLFKPDYDPNER